MVSGLKLQPLHLLLINCSQFVSFMILIIIIIIILFSFASAESNAKGRHIFFYNRSSGWTTAGHAKHHQQSKNGDYSKMSDSRGLK